MNIFVTEKSKGKKTMRMSLYEEMTNLYSKLIVVGAALMAMVAGAAETVPEIVSREALFWLDAADAATITRAANGTVQAWRSKGKAPRVAKAAARAPVYDTTTFGIPVVDCGEAGSGKDLRYPAVTGIRTVFEVVRLAKQDFLPWLGNVGTAPNPCPPPFFVRGKNAAYLYERNVGAYRVWNGTTEIALPAEEPVPDDTFLVVCLAGSNPGASDSLGNGRNLENRNGGRQQAELIAFDRLLSADERRAVADYLSTKWRRLAGARAAALFRPPPQQRAATRLNIGNGHVWRTIEFRNGQIRGSSYQLGELRGNEFLRADSPEFSFRVNDRLYTGASGWKDFQVAVADESTGGRETTLAFSANDGAFRVTLAYAVFPGLPLVRKTLTLVNTGKADLKLEAVNVEDVALAIDVTHSQTFRQYGRDGKPGPYVGDWDDPLVVVHDFRHRRGMAVGNETVGVLKRTGVFESGSRLRVGTTAPDQPFPFRRWLKPGESWQSAAAFTAPYEREADSQRIVNTVVQDYVRKHLGAHVEKLSRRPALVYTDWIPFYRNIDEQLIFKLVDAVADCGADDFVIDDGWQVNDGPGNGIASYAGAGRQCFGDWLVDPKKFPRGLKPVFDRMRARGIRPGLWFSLASAGRDSRVFRDHPEWFSCDRAGRPTNLHGGTEQFTACLSTAYYTYIRDKVLAYVKEFGLGYIKLDLSIVTSAYVYETAHSGCYSKSHQGHRDHAESLAVNYARAMELVDELHRAAPELYIDFTFETAGRLQLMDYGIARHADGNWLCNIEETGIPRMRYYAWGRSPALPATSLAIGNMGMGIERHLLAYKSVVGALPAMMGNPLKLSAAERAEFKRWTAWVRQQEQTYRIFSFRQDLPGFGEPGEGRWDGFARINTETKAGGVVGVFRENAAEASRQVAVRDLEPTVRYAILRGPDGTRVAELTGRELETKGFRVEFPNRVDGELFEIRRR